MKLLVSQLSLASVLCLGLASTLSLALARNDYQGAVIVTERPPRPELWKHWGFPDIFGRNKNNKIQPVFDQPPPPVTKQPKPISMTAVEEKEKIEFGDWAKLLFRPFELIKQIAKHFGLPLEATLEKLGKDHVLGFDSFLHPLVSTIKMIEDMFEADHCRLRFVCNMGGRLDFINESINFPPELLEGSSHLKALGEGVGGRECSAIYPNCEPKLRKSFLNLRNRGGAGSARSGRPEDAQKSTTSVVSAAAAVNTLGAGNSLLQPANAAAANQQQAQI